MGPAYMNGGVPPDSVVFVSRMKRCTVDPCALWLTYLCPVGDVSAVVLCDSHWNSVGESGRSAYMVVAEKCSSVLCNVTKKTSAWSPGIQRTPEPNVPLRSRRPKAANASSRL